MIDLTNVAELYMILEYQKERRQSHHLHRAQRWRDQIHPALSRCFLNDVLHASEVNLRVKLRELLSKFPGCPVSNPDWNSPADVHVSIDGNFSQRHLASAGDCPDFFDPEYFIPQWRLDSVRERLKAAGRKDKAAIYRSKSLHTAIDGCTSSFEAASNKGKEKENARYDDNGLMALVC